jgi:uncharacterized protein (TIGR03067 family)
MPIALHFLAMSSDLDQLQGTWYITSLEMDSNAMPGSALAGAHIVVKKNQFKSLGMSSDYEGIIELGESSKPKTFDLVFKTGPEKGNRNLGIYKLEGGKWTICLATRGSTRPKKFETRADSGFALQTLEREAKPLKASNVKATKIDSPAASGTPTPIEGEWAMIGAVINGAAMDKTMMDWVKRTTRGNVTTVMAGPQVMLKATFSLGTNPRDIDYINLEGVNKGKAQSGIYNLDGETLQICMSPPDKPRPSDFSSKAGDGRSYTTWRLVQK